MFLKSARAIVWAEIWLPAIVPEKVPVNVLVRARFGAEIVPENWLPLMVRVT